MKREIISFVKKTFMFFCHITNFQRANVKTVFFSSFSGQYSDNPRAISEALYNEAPDICQIWVIKDKFRDYIPSYVKVVKPMSIKLLIKQSRANVWVLNGAYSKQSGIYKNKHIYYIQTWHGDRAIKQVGYGAYQAMGQTYRHQEKNLPYMDDCNLFVVGSDFGAKQARNSFKYNGEILTEGMPRNDKLVNSFLYNKEIENIKKKVGISNKKVILYAPTFRDKNEWKQNCDVDLPVVLNILNNDNNEWVCLVRSHSLSKGIEIEETDMCFDVTWYPDMSDLLLITDILITDYSSSAADFILTGRPVVLSLFDEDEYRNQSRALCFEPDEAGFLVARNQEELNMILSNIEKYDHKKIAEKVNSFFGTKETGCSSRIIAKKIIQVCNNQ